jgi:hypothetical protein
MVRGIGVGRCGRSRHPGSFGWAARGLLAKKGRDAERILDFGERGWLAIDPTGLLGDRGFDSLTRSVIPTTQRQHQVGLRGELRWWLTRRTGTQAFAKVHLGVGRARPMAPETALVAGEIAATQLSL